MADNKQNTNPNVPNLSFKREQSESCFDSAERVINQKQNVPNLRFPEFTTLPLKNYKLGSIGESFTGLAGKSAEDFGSGKPYITYKNIFDNSRINLQIVDFVNVLSYESQNKVQFGDIFFTTSSETPEEVGMSSVLLDVVEECYLNSFCFGYRLNDIKQFNPEFFRFLLRANCSRKKIFVLAQGSTRYNISKNEVMKLSVSLPSWEEQSKIAKLLTLIENRITTQNKIIEDLKKLKVAISQVCFEQKPIDEIPLQKFFKKGKAGGTPTSTNKEYYDGEIPFLSINDITEQGKYIYSTEKHLSEKGLLNSSAWVVPVNSLILSMYASVGLTTINKIPLATSQAMFSMELKEPELIDYLYYYLTYFKYRYIHRYLETGTQSNINADIVRSIKIPNYGKSKNIEMSAMLANIDKKIEIENTYLQSLLSQKAYLLSNMFI